MSAEALGPNLAVLGILLLVAALSPGRSNLARTLVAAVSVSASARYMLWRWTDTVPEQWWLSGEGFYVLVWFVVELVIMADAANNTIILSRATNRTPQADENEDWGRSQPPDRLPSVDVFIPTYNESEDVLERTIVGAVSLDYPNATVWVLDDGRRPWVAALAKAKGARYLTRGDNQHAKAGNLNAALPRTSGELILVLDADFVPRSHMLWRIVGFFRDPKIAIVQTPQYFFNKDPVQTNLGLADRWADDQRLFFDVIMPSRDAWGAAFCCGTGFVIRRSALEAIGGIPTQSLCEDMMTSMQLKRHGFETIYLKEELCIGLAPESVKAFFVQRSRWSRGHIQTMFIKNGVFSRGLPFFYRLQFLPTYWTVQIPARIIYILLPLIFLLTGLPPLIVVDFYALLGHLGPWLIAGIGFIWWVGRDGYFPILTDASSLFLAIRIAPASLASLLKPFGVPFRVTPKGRSAAGMDTDRVVFYVCLTLLVATIGAITWNAIAEWRVVEDPQTLAFTTSWATFNALILGLTALIAREGPRQRGHERFIIGSPARCIAGSEPTACTVVNASLAGMFVRFGNHPVPEPGTTIFLTAPSIGHVRGLVVRRVGDGAGIRLVGITDATRAALVDLTSEGNQRRRRKEPKEGTRRAALRVDFQARARFVTDDGWSDCTIADASVSGALIRFTGKPPAALGELVTIELPNVGLLSARVARVQGEALGVAFEDTPDDVHDNLIRALYTVPRPITLHAPKSRALVSGIVKRLLGPDIVRPERR
jgi:cellulose synthase (UDP-forming)